jgi:hypothetical protein
MILLPTKFGRIPREQVGRHVLTVYRAWPQGARPASNFGKGKLTGIRA